MSKFNFENFRKTQIKFSINDEGNTFYPTSYGDELIDGQVYYLKRRKPPTPYALFIKDRLPEMKMENPRGDVGKFFIELGREWHYLDSQKKCGYYMKYNDEVKKFDLSKQSIPVGINPMLRRLSRERDWHESTKRPKFWEEKNRRHETTENHSSDEYNFNGQNIVNFTEDNRKFSGNKYPIEVLQTEYNEEDINNDAHEDSFSHNIPNKFMRSNGISSKFEKRYHSD